MKTQTTRRSRRGLWACQSGAELVEFALIFPTLLLVLGGVMDLGMLFQRYEVITNAAREGARVAVLAEYGANVQANVEARVNQYLTAAGLTGTHTIPAVGRQIVAAGTQCIAIRTVTVTYDSDLIILGPVFRLMGGGAARTVSATSSMREEIAATGC
jgi:Flp pilus assembly protein TadG